MFTLWRHLEDCQLVWSTCSVVNRLCSCVQSIPNYLIIIIYSKLFFLIFIYSYFCWTLIGHFALQAVDQPQLLAKTNTFWPTHTHRIQLYEYRLYYYYCFLLVRLQSTKDWKDDVLVMSRVKENFWMCRT